MTDSGLKRSLDDDSDAGALVKRAKTSNGGGELVVAGKGSKIKQVRLDSIEHISKHYVSNYSNQPH
jgi:hypothetical protein